MAALDFNDQKLKKHEVKLFPTVGIKGKEEAEMRATAALLSIIRAVPDFGGELIKKAGGPGGKAKNVKCFTEVGFLPDFPEQNDPARPDGIIRRVCGKNPWTALVEVKVASNPINENQIGTYQRWANSSKFQALITVSNQVNQPNGDPPYKYNRLMKSVQVKHFSWQEIHSIVQILTSKEGGIKDEDQQWMLKQLDYYLTDENSGIITPPSLGDHWYDVLKHVKADTLKVHSDLVNELVEYWLAFLQITKFKMEAEIGHSVKVRTEKKYNSDLKGLIKAECNNAISTCCLNGCLIFPRMDDIKLCLNLKTKELQLSHKINAPEEGLRDTRVKWIIKELKKLEQVPPKLRIKVDWKKYGLTTSATYNELNANIIPLLRGKNGEQIGNNVMPRCFILELEKPLLGARGKGSVQELKVAFDELKCFYDLVQKINRPRLKPPAITNNEENSTSGENDLASN